VNHEELGQIGTGVENFHSPRDFEAMEGVPEDAEGKTRKYSF